MKEPPMASMKRIRLAVVGLIAGTVIGVGLAVLMARFRIVERGLLPYVIASQTVPLIALAPQIATIAGNWGLPKWAWVSLPCSHWCMWALAWLEQLC